MPATAGRVRMPANNRVHSSAALQTHGIWQSAIGYDPYAPDQKDKQAGGASANHADIGASEQNAYDSFQGLLALARLTSSTANEARGSCKKCGRVGHLTFQCRNFLTITKEDVAAAAAAVERDRVGAKGKDVGEVSESDEDSSDEDSEISDSDEDSEMERALAARFGKTIRKSKSGGDAEKKGRLSSKKISSHSRKSRKDRDISFDEADDIDLDASRETSERKKGKTKKQIKTKKRRDLSSAEAEEEDESSGYEERQSRKHRHRHKKNRSSSKKKRSSSGFETDDSEDDRIRHMHKRDKNGDHRKEHGKHKKSKHRKRHSSTAELGFGEKEAERPHKYRNDGEMRYSEEESDEYRHKKARNDSSKHSEGGSSKRAYW